MTPGSILKAIQAFCNMVAVAMDLVSKASDIQAGVDKETSKSLKETLEVQQRIDDAPSKLVKPDRIDMDSWLRSPSSLPGKASGADAKRPAGVPDAPHQ